MFMNRTTRTFINIPKWAIEDKRLSLHAKGLYTYIQSLGTGYNDITLEKLSEELNITLEELNTVLSELVNTGYIDKGNNQYYVNMKPSKRDKSFEEFKVEDVEKLKNKNLYDQMAKQILEFTTDKEIKELLFKYLNLRMNPSSDSRFYKKDILYPKQFSQMLEKLKSFSNPKQSIQQSIDNEYYVFFENNYKRPIRDNAENDVYTDADIERIREQLGENLAWY